MQTSTAQLAAYLVLLAASCTGPALPESIWPPADFDLTVEELHFEGGRAMVTRRFRAFADGLVTYATAPRSVVDESTGTALPVFERLSVYRLVPTSIRALARRIDRCGILELDTVQGERGAVEGPSLVLTWRAFQQERVITARGRMHGAMADIVAIVAAHLPDGEAFELQAATGRPVVPVLRGVPAPGADAVAALQALRGVLESRPDDERLLLDVFALACALQRRSLADELLTRWLEVAAAARRQQQMFPEEEPAVSAAVLERMLPPAR